MSRMFRETGRWMVIPSWIPVLKNSELRQAYLTGDNESTLRNGKIGMVDRFTLYVSNNLTGITDGSDTKFIMYLLVQEMLFHLHHK